VRIRSSSLEPGNDDGPGEDEVVGSGDGVLVGSVGGGGEESGGGDESAGAVVSGSSANAIPGVVAAAAPKPRATASAPMRPMYLA
jgi:hypothetical protein